MAAYAQREADRVARPAAESSPDLAVHDGLNARSAVTQAKATAARLNARAETVQRKPTRSDGLPDPLRANMEAMSGIALDDVRVHRNSDKPAQMQAHAYAQGTDIHLGPGQEKHLPHEAWHVVQQKQGRVRATWQMADGTQVNNSSTLEREADIMGAGAGRGGVYQAPVSSGAADALVQRIGHSTHSIVQCLTGAGNQPGTAVHLQAASLDNAIRLSAEEINRRARTSNLANGDPVKTAVVGNHNGGNLYIEVQYPLPAPGGTLKSWIELTDEGGGYVKRVRVESPAGTMKMDRVIDEDGTAFQKALVLDRMGSTKLTGSARMDPVHGVDKNDEDKLVTADSSDRSADNYSKMIGEGARFGWLAQKLADRKIGNLTRGIFKIAIKVPQEGRFEIDPTFEQLWGAWRAAFGRAYMQDLGAAKSLLRERLIAGLSRNDNAPLGNAPLKSGNTANGDVTSLLDTKDRVALVDNPNTDSAMAMVSKLHMKWTAQSR